MPELPEVETIKNGLAPHMENHVLEQIICRRRDLRVEIPPELEQICDGQRIQSLSRRSKYLLIHLQNDHTIIVHLGMSGKMTLRPTMPNEFQKHDHVAIVLSSGQVAVFNDARRFGLVTLCETNRLEQHPLITRLGPEPLTDSFNTTYLCGAIHHRNIDIKLAIMNSHVVVGVGNIYASESLFRSNIHPAKPCSKISKKQMALLVENIKQVLVEAIESGGSTLRDYVRSTGDAGYFQHNFRVYGREGEPCLVCGTQILRMVQQNRSTFFCPKCQKS